MRRVVALVAVALLGLLVGVAAPAQAHAYLRSIEPADGSVLQAPPTRVVLTFSEDVLNGTAQLRLTGPDGPDRPVPVTVRTAGPVVTGTLSADLVDGAYTLLWRVTSADGHPISARSGFTVSATAGAGSPSDSPTVSASSPPSTVLAASPSGDGATPAAAIPSSAPVNPLEPSGLSDGERVLVTLGAALAAAAGVGLLVIRSRRGRP